MDGFSFEIFEKGYDFLLPGFIEMGWFELICFTFLHVNLIIVKDL